MTTACEGFLSQLAAIQSILDGWAACLDFQKSRLPDPTDYLRLVVVGHKGAGKTSLIEALTGLRLQYRRSPIPKRTMTAQCLETSAWDRRSMTEYGASETRSTAPLPGSALPALSIIPPASRFLSAAACPSTMGTLSDFRNQTPSRRSNQAVASSPPLPHTTLIPLLVKLQRGPSSCRVTFSLDSASASVLFPSLQWQSMNTNSKTDTVVIDVSTWILHLEQLYGTAALASFRAAINDEGDSMAVTLKFGDLFDVPTEGCENKISNEEDGVPRQSQHLSSASRRVCLCFDLESLDCIPSVLQLGLVLENAKTLPDFLMNGHQSIRVDVSGPNLPNVEFLEVPGTERKPLFSAKAGLEQPRPRKENTTASVELCKKIRECAKQTLRTYALKKNTVLVSVMDAAFVAEASLAPQRVSMPDDLRWFVEVEPRGNRTVVVLSKLDSVKNPGRLILCLLNEGLPWNAEYERRAIAMYRRSKTAVPSDFLCTASEPPKEKPQRGSRGTIFRMLGLSHPQVVGITLVDALPFSPGPISALVSSSTDRLLHHLESQRDSLECYKTLMQQDFALFFGVERLSKILMTAITLVVGSQCSEPAVVLIAREASRLKTVMEKEVALVRATDSQPQQCLDALIDRFQEALRNLFDGADAEPVTDSELSVHAKMSSLCRTAQHELELMDINAMATEAERLSLQARFYLENMFQADCFVSQRHCTKAHGNSPKSSAANQSSSLDPGSVISPTKSDCFVSDYKTALAVEYCCFRLERAAKQCVMYLNSQIQNLVQAEFSSYMTEEQMKAMEATLLGVQQTQLLRTRRDLRHRFDMLFQQLLSDDRHLYTPDTVDSNPELSEQVNPSQDSHRRTLVHEHIHSGALYIVPSLLNLRHAILWDRSEKSVPEWVWFLHKIIMKTGYTKPPSGLQARLRLMERAETQLDRYVEHYPLLFHSCIAAVTTRHQRSTRQNEREEQTPNCEVTANAQSYKVDCTDSDASCFQANSDFTLDICSKLQKSQLPDEKSSYGIAGVRPSATQLVSAKALSYLCSGGVGAMLYLANNHSEV